MDENSDMHENTDDENIDIPDDTGTGDEDGRTGDKVSTDKGKLNVRKLEHIAMREHSSIILGGPPHQQNQRRSTPPPPNLLIT